ncbi:MAG: ADP-ribosylglycohydrolase family protein [Clostridia bacterium]|nr:ADP-ribosylglycohydrolase family protein [Clostridia bacterium]
MNRSVCSNILSCRNGILGFAIGDAMGVPNEFCLREKLMQDPVTEMIGFGSHDVPKGSWSDDTSLTLATMDSIIENKSIEPEDMATKFLQWLKEAKYTPTNNVFDVGGTTLKALARFEAHLRIAPECGGDGDMDNGNGSLMRMLPIAYFVYYKNLSEEKIFELVKTISGITHKHEISVMGCFIYVCYAFELLKKKSKDEAYTTIKNIDYTKYFKEETIERYDRLLNSHIATLPLENINSSDYVVHSLEAILWVIFNTYTFNESIIGAINLGNDTDTIGACVGGLAGIIYTLKDINPHWEKDLIKYDYIKELCVKFDEACNS